MILKTLSVLFTISQIFFLGFFSYIHDKSGMALTAFGLAWAVFTSVMIFQFHD